MFEIAWITDGHETNHAFWKLLNKVKCWNAVNLQRYEIE